MRNTEIIKDNFEMQCTGCGACKNVCPTNAIEICENKDGFLFPVIDETKCIDCKKCQRTCPANNELTANLPNPSCYAVWAKDDIRIKCSSGGVFGAIAQKFLEEGDYVSGAVYKDLNHIEHIVTNNIEDLPKIIGSKYVQSDTKDCYKQIKEILESGKRVLFCGCPCQVSGLNQVIGENENLYTMDLICHGVPSYKFYRKYLEGYENIKEIDFRDKSVFGWSTEINITLKNGKKINKRHEGDTFYKGFLPCLVQRNSCEMCRFSSLPRQADLTIGDFWGVERYNPAWNDRRGTSVVLVNNKKGEALLNKYKEQFSMIEEAPIEEAMRVNSNIAKPFKPHHAKRRFFRDIDVVGDVNKMVDMCIQSKYDVGIVGLWFGLNFGSVLTYYALYEVINDLGYSALMINKPDFMWIPRYENPNTVAQRFIRKHCNVSMVRGKDSLKELSNHCDAFVVGSDVVWNYEICGKTAGQFLFLDFADDRCKKIAYASSTGTGFNAPPREHTLSKYYINKFDAISVREQEAADICKEQFGVNADLVMDPVFLCDREKYIELSKESQKSFPEKYLSSYILGPDETKRRMLETLKERFNIPFRIMPNPNHDESISRLGWANDEEILHNGDVEDFLACINNSEYFFADSFHGLCFAVILHKKFVVVTGKHQKDNCRFKNLLNSIGEIDRLVFIEDFLENPSSIIEKMEKPIDFNRIDTIIKKRAAASKKWLDDALKTPKSNTAKNPLEDIVDLLMKENDRLSKSVNSLMQFTGLDLPLEDNIFNYLTKLKRNCKDKIIIISAKDTPGSAINPELQVKLSSLGIGTNLQDKHWHGYLAVINDGVVMSEQCIYDSNVEANITLNDTDIHVLSGPLHASNVASIKINGVEHAVNSRGLNIVVYQKNAGMVIDSVCFDTHHHLFGVKRK